MYMLLFQKLKDNREQVIKKRKKKEVNSVEEKNQKKNKVPKQGWESVTLCGHFSFNHLAKLLHLYIYGIPTANQEAERLVHNSRTSWNLM